MGGMGTRLRSVLPDTPKPLAAVGNKSFLDLLVRQLQYQGIVQLVMCTGYMANQIENEFGDGRAWNVVIDYSREPQAVGTAGAVKLATRYLRDLPDFLVINGDTFLEIDYRHLIRFHREHGGLVSMAVVEVDNAARYGTVHMRPDGRVTGFVEKSGRESAGLINAGIYVFSNPVLDHIPNVPSGLERDVFPQLLDQGVYALEHHGMFIDIGTPEDYEHAQRLYHRLDEVVLRGRRSYSHERERNLTPTESGKDGE